VPINWGILKEDIIDAAVDAVNNVAAKGLVRAREDAPVRKVFSGGRQTVRFKTAAEIDAGREVRARLGLAPERLATAEAVGRVQALGINPRRGNFQVGAARAGRPRSEEGFARTIAHPASNRPGSRQVPGMTDLFSGEAMRERTASRRERGYTRNSRNRENTFQPRGQDVRVLDPRALNRLSARNAEFGLTTRGRYELASGRATSTEATGLRKNKDGGGSTSGLVGEGGLEATYINRVGGNLRASIRVEEADVSQYPIIKASLVAGGGDVDYAKYQEMGTRHNPEHPFLRPRIPEWREQLPVALLRSLRRLGR
jgi:hypothetical protein